MGFETGVKQWGNFLKPGGYLAVSEITWLTNKQFKDYFSYGFYVAKKVSDV